MQCHEIVLNRQAQHTHASHPDTHLEERKNKDKENKEKTEKKNRKKKIRETATLNNYSHYENIPGTYEYQTHLLILVVRNRKAGLGWISHLRMGAFYTKVSIMTPQFPIFLQISACLRIIPPFLTKWWMSCITALWIVCITYYVGFSSAGRRATR